jgi:hypothetical protein
VQTELSEDLTGLCHCSFTRPAGHLLRERRETERQRPSESERERERERGREREGEGGRQKRGADFNLIIRSSAHSPTLLVRCLHETASSCLSSAPARSLLPRPSHHCTSLSLFALVYRSNPLSWKDSLVHGYGSLEIDRTNLNREVSQRATSSPFQLQLTQKLSNFMFPLFRGDIAFLDNSTAAPLLVGQIVAFRITGRDVLIFHRIIELRESVTGEVPPLSVSVSPSSSSLSAVSSGGDLDEGGHEHCGRSDALSRGTKMAPQN